MVEDTEDDKVEGGAVGVATGNKKKRKLMPQDDGVTRSEQPVNIKKKKGGKNVGGDKKKSTSPSKKVPLQRPSPSTVHDESGDESEVDIGGVADSVCSAPQCICPMANQISWVQCDLCQQWFHLLCVGLTPESVEKIDIYNCCLCKRKSISERKALIGGVGERKSPSHGPERKGLTVASTSSSSTLSTQQKNPTIR